MWNEEGTLVAVGLRYTNFIAMVTPWLQVFPFPLHSFGAVFVFSSSGRLLAQLMEKIAPSDVGCAPPLTDLTFVPCPSSTEDEDSG